MIIFWLKREDAEFAVIKVPPRISEDKNTVRSGEFIFTVVREGLEERVKEILKNKISKEEMEEILDLMHAGISLTVEQALFLSKVIDFHVNLDIEDSILLLAQQTAGSKFNHDSENLYG